MKVGEHIFVAGNPIKIRNAAHTTAARHKDDGWRFVTESGTVDGIKGLNVWRLA